MALTMPNLDLVAHEWRRNAACKESDSAVFFPVGTTGRALTAISSAKAVCERCECREACLEFALLTNQDSGVWGGKSEEERRVMRRMRAAHRAQAAAAAAS